MARILFFVVLAFLVWLVLRVMGGRRSNESGTRPADVVPPQPAAVESVLQCAWCGVHVPADAALALPDGRLYCSVEHRDAASAAVRETTRAG